MYPFKVVSEFCISQNLTNACAYTHIYIYTHTPLSFSHYLLVHVNLITKLSPFSHKIHPQINQSPFLTFKLFNILASTPTKYIISQQLLTELHNDFLSYVPQHGSPPKFLSLFFSELWSSEIKFFCDLRIVSE